jgi:hypothetical protein
LVEAGLEVFVIFTEPGQEVLADLPADKLHWHYFPPKAQSFADFGKSMEMQQKLSFEALTKMTDSAKADESQFLDVIGCLANFTDQRTGKAFGPVEAFGPDRCIVLDSWTGLSSMSMSSVVGNKPVPSPGEWGLAMKKLDTFMTMFSTGLSCTGVVIGHVEREVDEISGGIKLMVSTLGKKLAPILPRYFSECIYAKRDGAKFLWSTADVAVDTKARALPISDKLDPTFRPIIERWRTTLKP